MASDSSLSRASTACEACPRLRRHCQKVAREKRRAYASETYWGRPVPSFGDSDARLIVVGLAPGAHGANRTGRIFTGDRSGDWLYRALYKAGFASQPESRNQDDGLNLRKCRVTCVVKCAPPDNKPSPAEVRRCTELHLRRELLLHPECRVYVALGKIAWDVLCREFGSKSPFKHGAKLKLENGRTLLGCYNPSQQNTFTGRLTEPMLDSIFEAAGNIVASGSQPDRGGSSRKPKEGSRS